MRAHSVWGTGAPFLEERIRKSLALSSSPRESGAPGPRQPGASASYRGMGGAARREEAASTWLPRVCGKEGVWAQHPGLTGVLSPPEPGILGLNWVVGRELLGEVAGGARILEVFVQSLTSVMVVLIYRALFPSPCGRWS